jgi:hypothetical protein
MHVLTTPWAKTTCDAPRQDTHHSIRKRDGGLARRATVRGAANMRRLGQHLEALGEYSELGSSSKEKDMPAGAFQPDTQDPKDCIKTKSSRCKLTAKKATMSFSVELQGRPRMRTVNVAPVITADYHQHKLCVLTNKQKKELASWSVTHTHTHTHTHTQAQQE